jgi:hypothetical protein
MNSMPETPVWFNILIAIDQLGNAIAGGNPDDTISARVGYFASDLIESVRKWFWKGLQSIIDGTFEPVQGPGHCFHAREEDEKDTEGDVLTRVLLTLFVIVGCAILAPILWLVALADQFIPFLGPKRVQSAPPSPSKKIPLVPHYDVLRQQRLRERVASLPPDEKEQIKALCEQGNRMPARPTETLPITATFPPAMTVPILGIIPPKETAQILAILPQDEMAQVLAAFRSKVTAQILATLPPKETAQFKVTLVQGETAPDPGTPAVPQTNMAATDNPSGSG